MRKCLEVAETDYDEGTSNKMRVKYEFHPFKNRDNNPEIWVVPHDANPTLENTLMTKRIIRRKGNVLFPIASMIDKMEGATGGYIDIYLVSKGQIIRVDRTMMTVGVWRITPNPSSPTAAPTAAPSAAPTAAPTSTPTAAPNLTDAPTTYATKFKNVSFKDISLNNVPGRKLTVTDGISSVTIRGQRTGFCETGCPGCVKIVRLKMFDPNGNMVKEHCIFSHTRSQCSWVNLSAWIFPIDTSISGEWKIQVWGRWAYCSTGYIHYWGDLAWITVP